MIKMIKMIKMINIINIIKMIKKIYLLTIIVGILCAACFKKEEIPVLVFNGEANMTIAEFQKMHVLSTGNPATLIDTNIIITGIVTSTDEFGSCYQELFFQDETGGISIRIASSTSAPYYPRYRIGQRVFVKTEGLHLGNYVSGNNTGFYQLGVFSDGRMQNLTRNWEARHIFRSEVPVAPPAPKIITSRNDIVKEDYHTLVRLESCSFRDANGETKYFEAPLHTTTTISRTITLNGGGIVEARISRYNTFADDILPEGKLDITGILTMFGNPSSTTPTAQLIIRSLDDVEIFPSVKILGNFDMSTDPFEQGWKNEQITGTTAWSYSYATQGGSRVQIQAPAGSETVCRFVSPKFNFTGEKDVALIFNYRIMGEADENLQVLYTVNGTAWHPLEFTLKTGTIEEVVLPLTENIATNPNLQIAFQYKTTTVFPRCAIMNIAFKANVII